MAERVIAVEFVNPPIPLRQFDWCAWYEGEEEKGECGFGRTREEAIAELRRDYGEPEPVSMPSVAYRMGRLTEADYDEAIADLQAARAQAVDTIHGGYAHSCAICTDGDHTAESCHHNPLVLARRWARASAVFVCYHCGYVAYSDAEAKAHFGASEDEVARCLVAKAPEMWKTVPAFPTNGWIMDLDKLLLAKYGQTPGGTVVAESISLVLASAPAPPEEIPGENETASTPGGLA